VTSHDGSNPRKQLACAERLGYLVVRAQPKAHHSIRFLGTGRDDYNWNLRSLSQPDGQLISILASPGKLEGDGINCLVAHHSTSVLQMAAISRLTDSVSLLPCASRSRSRVDRYG